MAIDDNTSYELTGYQVKDLAQKIRGKADDDVFVGAGASVAGSRGLVPAPAAGDNSKFLKGDGTWQSLADNYSTTEQNTGATWIDGKPIYKKTIDFGSLPNNSTKNVAHGISNLGDVIDIRGTAKTSWGTYQLPLVFSGQDVNYITNVSVNATNISMSNSADRSGFTAYVTLYYTKTTD